MDDELSREAVDNGKQAMRFAFTKVGEPTAREMIHVMQKAVLMARNKIRNPKGKMSVKQLLRQGQGADKIDVSDLGMRDFERIAGKYGLDFAVVKSRGEEPPRYTVFFKAKDTAVIEKVVKDYTASQINRREHKKTSLVAALAKMKQLVADMPKRVAEKFKEPER